MQSKKSRRHYHQWMVADQAVEAALEHLTLADAIQRAEERLETLMLRFLNHRRERYQALIARCADADQELRLRNLKSTLAMYLWHTCGALLTGRHGAEAARAFLESGKTSALENRITSYRSSWLVRWGKLFCRCGIRDM